MSVFWCPVPGCVSGCIYKCSECVGMTLSDQIGHRTPGSYIILTLATTTSTIRYTLRPRNMQIHTAESLEIIKRAIFRTKVIVMCNVSVMQRNVLSHSLIIKPRVFTSPGALGVCSLRERGLHIQCQQSSEHCSAAEINVMQLLTFGPAPPLSIKQLLLILAQLGQKQYCK